MNKADLVNRIAGACEISKSQATTAIDTMVDSVTSSLRKGDRVALIGLAHFRLAAQGPQWPEPADGRHNQDCCPQSSQIHSR